jgi:hypothetical protein
MSKKKQISVSRKAGSYKIRVITDFCWLDERPEKVANQTSLPQRKQSKIVNMHGGAGNGFAMPMFPVNRK